MNTPDDLETSVFWYNIYGEYNIIYIYARRR